MVRQVNLFILNYVFPFSLGMNHDGETNENNHCDPDKFLMSPALGPGKVTWSSCSNTELEKFMAGV